LRNAFKYRHVFSIVFILSNGVVREEQNFYKTEVTLMKHEPYLIDAEAYVTLRHRHW